MEAPGVRKVRSYVFKSMFSSNWMNSCSPDYDPQSGIMVRLFNTLAKVNLMDTATSWTVI